jgi:hypothetical protein
MHQFANNQLHNEHLKLNSSLSSSTQKDSLKILPPVKASCASDTKVQAQDLAKKSNPSMSWGQVEDWSCLPSFLHFVYHVNHPSSPEIGCPKSTENKKKKTIFMSIGTYNNTTMAGEKPSSSLSLQPYGSKYQVN